MIYLDSAATTLQKPAAVARAAARAVSRLSSPGRGGYPPAERAETLAFACRETAARLFHLEPERVVFTFNATHSLNLALKSVIRPGDRVLLSGYEHNAVTRPLAAIPQVERRVAATPLFEPELFLNTVRAELERGVGAVVCTHVSNVFGYVLPIGQVSALCRAYGVPLIVDAAQSAGVLPVDCDGWGADYIALPGHKGLYGPQGTGLLLCGKQAQPSPLLEGGTGSLSRAQAMPELLPDRLEAGTHNMPGIAGLLAGLRYVEKTGTETIHRRERFLAQCAVNGLSKLNKVQVFSSPGFQHQTGVVSFRVKEVDCQAVGRFLAERGICVRAGLHCAPLAHETAGTLETGTVRFSVSPWNTRQEIAAFLGAMGQLVKAPHRFLKK